MTAEKLLFAMLRSVICGWEADEQVKTACTPELLGETFALARKHDLGHFVGQAAADWKLPDGETVKAAKQVAMQALYRYMRLEQTYQQLCVFLEQEKIPFIPLKGTILRNEYPQPWMRTSCDIDILVKQEMVEETSRLLQEKAGYRYGYITSHDVTLHAPNGVHLELHFDTIEDAISPEAQQVLSTVWEVAEPVRAGSCHLAMPEAMFYYYHIAHMAKHFQNGGCGIRPFWDLWILDQRTNADREGRMRLLEKGGMMAFWKASEKLVAIWADNETGNDEMSKRFEQFILHGGVYGSSDSQVQIRQEKTGGRFGYIMSRIFQPYDMLKYTYPVLIKHKWLFPFYQVVRWFRLLRKDSRERMANQLQASSSIDQQIRKETAQLLNYLGL